MDIHSFGLVKSEEPHLSGVGFVIKYAFAISLSSLLKGVSDYIITLTDNLDKNTITLVSYYTPEQEKDENYN